MAKEIRKVAVLGSGVMGSGIAAHLANAGMECYLLDLDGPTATKIGLIEELTEKEKEKGLTEESPEFRNRLAQKGLEGALKAKPAAFFHKSLAKKVTVGNYEDHSAWMGEADWIIEVVAERLDIKKKVYENIEKHRKPGTIVSSNTSGLLLKDLVDERSEDFKKCFLITHFFNPVRYMRLLELVTGPDTDPEITRAVADFCSDKMGKGIVYAKDTPNFVANRIGVHAMMALLQEIKEKKLSVEFVDKVLSKSIGRPMGPFRLTDLVGLDTMVHVAENTYEYCKDDEDRDLFKSPDFVKTMVEKKRLGNKTKGGFWKVEKKDGKKNILALDLESLEYRPKEKVRAESLGEVRSMEDVSERIQYLFEEAEDEAGDLVWYALSSSMVYAANRVPEIADDIVNVDNALKWGFNWKLGPFELWDTIGVEDVVDRLEEDDRPVPKLAQKVLEKGNGSFYGFENGQRTFFDVKTETYKPVPKDDGVLILADLKKQNRVVKKNPSASLLDLGDGVFCVEFHTKMNSIDDGIIEMLHAGVDETENNGKALVLHNEGEHFSAGANIFLVAMLAQQKAFNKLEDVVGMFQGINMRLKYASVPVVSAPFNYTFGGGCEISMSSDAICGHAELYIGLVEVGVGLVPAGAGCSQFLLRAKKLMESTRVNPGPLPISQYAFETIAFAKVATSAEEGRRIGYVIREADRYIMDRAKVLGEAKKQALEMSEGYQPPEKPIYHLPGTGGRMALQYGVDQFVAKGTISEHDAKIGYWLARVLTGGDVHPTDPVTEQELLDLEKEAFVSLCGEEKTLARIQHMLTKGKPLRN